MFYSKFKRELKEAFSKIKEEMKDLKIEIKMLKEKIDKLTNLFLIPEKCAEYVPNFSERFKNLSFGTSKGFEKENIKNLNELRFKNEISIGNEGVSALRQQIGNIQAIYEEKNKSINNLWNELNSLKKEKIEEKIAQLKKSLKEVFRHLTKQEFYVFSLIYQLEEQLGGPVTYSDLAAYSNLTPNSLRDYVSKLISKKIPIIKEKVNNKIVLLKIAPELRNIETLDSLMKIVENA